MKGNPKILLVDDIPEYLDTMELNLPDFFLALKANSFQEAQEVFGKGDPPELAVIDIRLVEDDPENRDGLTLLEWIKRNHPQTKIIMISAYHDFEFEAESLALGAVYFLKKPIQPDEFFEIVRDVYGVDR